MLYFDETLEKGDDAMSLLSSSPPVCIGVLLAGLVASTAQSQETPSQQPQAKNGQPRDSSNGWDKGPAPGGPRRPRPLRGDVDGPPGPPPEGELRRGGPPDGRGGPGGPGRGPGPGGPEGRGPDGRGPEGPGGPPPGRFGPPMDFESLKTRDPELYNLTKEDRDLERQTRDQAEQYRHADKAEQAKIKEKLAEIVDKHFAVRQQLRTLEVKRLEQQVKQLRDRIDQREKERKDIVGKRIDELIETADRERF
jgi:hypothetical protein